MMGSMGWDHIPESGISSIPLMGCFRDHTARMAENPREIIAANLRRLMASDPDLDTLVKVEKASGVSKSVVGRITKAENNYRIEHCAGIAEAFGLQPWQLLVPNLDPDAKPKLAGLHGEWPFEYVNKGAYLALASDARVMVQGYLRRMIEELSVSNPDVNQWVAAAPSQNATSQNPYIGEGPHGTFPPSVEHRSPGTSILQPDGQHSQLRPRNPSTRRGTGT